MTALAFAKENPLPLAFVAAGVGYYLFTLLGKPQLFRDHATASDLHAFEQWNRHARDAKFALVAGVGAGALLWWMRDR